jgi:hypothetical protein
MSVRHPVETVKPPPSVRSIIPNGASRLSPTFWTALSGQTIVAFR